MNTPKKSETHFKIPTLKNIETTLGSYGIKIANKESLAIVAFIYLYIRFLAATNQSILKITSVFFSIALLLSTTFGNRNQQKKLATITTTTVMGMLLGSNIISIIMFFFGPATFDCNAECEPNMMLRIFAKHGLYSLPDVPQCTTDCLERNTEYYTKYNKDLVTAATEMVSGNFFHLFSISPDSDQPYYAPLTNSPNI